MLIFTQKYFFHSSTDTYTVSQSTYTLRECIGSLCAKTVARKEKILSHGMDVSLWSISHYFISHQLYSVHIISLILISSYSSILWKEWQKNRDFIFPVNKYSDYTGSYNTLYTFKREVNNMFNNPDSCISYERILCKSEFLDY